MPQHSQDVYVLNVDRAKLEMQVTVLEAEVKRLREKLAQQKVEIVR